jgi:hypothetical protein
MMMLYARKSLLQIFKIYLLSLAVLVVVFAIEKFDFILRVAIEYDLRVKGFLILFASMIPSVVDSIIPIATIVAVYFVLLSKREGREFLILSAAGCGVKPILQIAGTTAALSVLMSLLTSGYLKPAASLAFRLEYEKALAGLVSKGPQTGRFFEGGENVLHVWAQPSDSTRKMRVFGFEGNRLDQIFLSDCSNMYVENGQLKIDACEARVYVFQPPPASQGAAPTDVRSGCRLCPDQSGQLDVVRIQGGGSTRSFDMKTLFRPIERDHGDELNLPALLTADQSGFSSPSNARRGMTSLFLAFANVLAVALSIVAVALTTPKTRFAALPGAIAALMGCTVLIGSGALIPDTLSSPGRLGAAIAALCVLCAVAFSLIIRIFSESITAPRLVRK